MKFTASFCLSTLALLTVTTWVNGYHQSENITSVLASVNPRPCLPANNNNGYNYFRMKHILGSQFDTNNKTQWLRYLNSRGLCGRVPVQTFIQAGDEMAIRYICRGGGINLQQNVCISRRLFTVFHVYSQKPRRKPCIVRGIKRLRHPVVVACDAIANKCLPVHYERYTNQRPDQNARTCQ